MHIQKKLKLIREQMKMAKIDVYIIPSSDPHASEYLPDYYKSREWASGFSGSAGTLVLTLKDAALWTDGRYYLQAEKELEGSTIKLIKAGLPDSPEIGEWIDQVLQAPFKIGFNGFQMMAGFVETLKNHFENTSVTYDFTSNLVDKIWLDRPLLPAEKVYKHPDNYVGASTQEKLMRIRKAMKTYGASSHLLTKLDDIAWITNLRGNDIKHNPYFMSYLFITLNTAFLYVDPLKLNDEIVEAMHAAEIKIKHYDDLPQDLESLSCETGILVDKSATPYYIWRSLKNRCKIINKPNPSTSLKAIKNEIELAHITNCHIQDGVAVVKFMYALSTVPDLETLTEYDIDTMITEKRAENPLFIGRSFSTIAGYADHGAIMHYKAEPKSAYPLKPEGFLLVDSGGQYMNGTTDITRTIAMGKLTQQEMTDYTLTLKSMMALSRMTFLKGATGTHLDTIARMHMWAEGMDYKSGTGHGIGYLLGVHEGPHRVSMNPSSVPLVPGMILSNEPGVYRSGAYGIRLENVLAVVPHLENEFGTFYKFKTLTLCPFDLNAIDLNQLTETERLELNAYHAEVFKELSPYLSASEAKWLKDATRSL
ncbi:aminopeptidase P family protein [Fusibacter tunisiensis]|uniref:Xaa-Pro aminopeptidase n=1 Tax=Fusibacter tunisiensis TaxID=1008308 RepID=A0ABS2MSG3_9FIRM|nr:aminopeptidase P family protein [Fusibacter tunisiensis]MBM7562338.1 Xaa-Pro aminopeptidase [Fusibacter tunisiensis]